MQTRKQFIKTLATSGTLTLLPTVPLLAHSKESYTKITILHTNDQHSRIEPFEASHKKFGGAGGFASRATLIDQIRKKEDYVLLLDAGDIFQGTPYFNFFGGELEFKLMSKLGYDLATLGNHDFDNGVNGFIKQLPHAQFNFVNANYNFKNSALDGIVKPYQIFKKGDIKIGVFGLGVQLEGLVDPKNYGEIQYLDPIEIAKDQTYHLKHKEKCDLVICLSHLGYQYQDDTVSDIKLAQNTHDIDLIIGGHTHTFLDAPTIVKNSHGENVIINQVGWAGLYLGQIDFYFSKGKKKSTHKRIQV
ncbi:5'-nucleotidase [Flavobacteriaceae bacterium UJ101]|nr:5'-nucleotidase [Flavobacteriaceae bacterium UJ101]